MSVYFGQTSNWQKLVQMVTETGSYPATAAEYVDQSNALRIHCGAESQVQMRVEFYLTSPEDFQMLEKFLKYFGLPRNGFHIVNTGLSYGVTYQQVQSEQPAIAGPNNHR